MSVLFDPAALTAHNLPPASRIDALIGMLTIVDAVASERPLSVPVLPPDLARRYIDASSIVRRRFDTVALDAARIAAIGARALAGGCHPAAAALLAAEIRDSLGRLGAMLHR